MGSGKPRVVAYLHWCILMNKAWTSILSIYSSDVIDNTYMKRANRNHRLACFVFMIFRKKLNISCKYQKKTLYLQSARVIATGAVVSPCRANK